MNYIAVSDTGQHRVSPYFVLIIVGIVLCAGVPAIGQAPTPFSTRFTLTDRVPNLTVFEDLARNRAPFHHVVAGDFNGDGISDLLITNGDSSGATQQAAGRAYVIFGKRSLGSPGNLNLANAQADLTILGSGQFSQLGYNATASDLNGDGIDDMVLTSIGAIYIVFGRQAFDSNVIDLARTPADVKISAPNISPGLAVGDINGDGANDLIFGSEASGPGNVSVLLGPFIAGTIINLASTSPDILMTGRFALDGFGFGIVAADVNGDGISDLVLGSPAVGRDGWIDAGVVDIFMGSPDLKSGLKIALWQTASDAIILGAYGGADSGDAVGRFIWSGDVNGDGIADIIIGDAGSTRLGNGLGPTSAGEVIIVFGSPSMKGRVIDIRAGQQDVTIQGTAAAVDPNVEWGDTLGVSVAAKDIDGDHVTDILIGAPGAGGKKDPGQAYVVLGSPELTSGTLIKTSEGDEDIAIAGAEKLAYLGMVVASGDLNGDGFSDLILEAPYAETPGGSQQGTGAIYIYFGGPVRAPEITKAKFKEGNSKLLITGSEFTGDVRVEINGMTINREVMFFPDEQQLVVKGTRQELNLSSDFNQVVVLRKGTRSNVAKVKG